MKKICFMLCLAVVAAGCQKMADETKAEGVVYEEGEMRFEMNMPVTKVTETEFEEGDRIGLYVTSYDETPVPLQVSGNWANNIAATLTGADWVTEKKIFWSEGKMDVYAYYPYMAISSVDEQPFAVALDQNAEGVDGGMGGYEASDFLWAKTEGSVAPADDSDPSAATVSLTFKHCLTKFVIRLEKGPDYEGEFPDESELYIHNVVPTATIDFATGAVTKDMFGEPTTIRARRVDDGTFEAIIVPQRVDSRRPFIEFIANGVSYLIEDTFHFKVGKQHTMSLIINSNPDQVSVDIGGSVEGGWN